MNLPSRMIDLSVPLDNDKIIAKSLSAYGVMLRDGD